MYKFKNSCQDGKKKKKIIKQFKTILIKSNNIKTILENKIRKKTKPE